MIGVLITLDDGDGIGEGAEDGDTFTISLTGDTYNTDNAATLKTNVTLAGLPAGVDYSVARTSSTQLTVTLSGNRTTDYDADIGDAAAEFTVTVNSAILSSAGVNTSADTGVVFTAKAGVDGAQAIEAYANTGTPIPTLDDYTAAGVTGVTADNLSAMNELVNATPNNSADVDTVAELDAIAVQGNLLAALGTDEGDGAATSTNATAAQLNDIIGVSGALAANEAAYQAYIDANEGNLSNPATAAEIQAMITSVNAAEAMRVALGTDEGDGAATSTNATAAQLNDIIGVSGALAANESAYQGYIDANEGNFSSPATAAEIQAMITSVNAAEALRVALGTDEGDGAATSTNATAAQLNDIIGVSGALAANESAYQGYIDANEGNFSSPATAAEIQAMITSVNAAEALRVALGTDEGDGAATSTNATAAQLNDIIGVSGALAANESAYQGYIDANQDNLSEPATVAEIQAMVTAVNASMQTFADLASGAANALTPEDFVNAGVIGVTADNLPTISALIAQSADDASEADTREKIQTWVSIVDQADGEATLVPAADGFTAIGIEGITATNIDSMNALIASTVGRVDVDSIAKVSALAKIMDQADGVSNQTLTVDDFVALGISGAEESNLAQILSAMANTANDGSELNSLDGIQNLVNQFLPAAPAAEAAPAAAAVSQSASQAQQSTSLSQASVIQADTSTAAATAPSATASVSAVSSDAEVSVSDGLTEVQSDRVVSVNQTAAPTGVVGEAVEAATTEQADITSQASDAFGGMVTEVAQTQSVDSESVSTAAVAGQQPSTPLDQIIDQAFASVLGAGTPTDQSGAAVADQTGTPTTGDQASETAAAEQAGETASAPAEAGAGQDNAQSQPATDAGDNAEVTEAEQAAEGEPVAALNTEGWLIQMEEKRQAFEQQRQQLADIAGSVNVA